MRGCFTQTKLRELGRKAMLGLFFLVIAKLAVA
jgi:hypothetical protein